ncbi:hypothetical protein F4775DRAFT_593230 [Biscogniauxia sp. FL1348]|nr:hypothetical protein F4775DRAFT_593230 [Biscogniauxia sp. FL1348]
MGFDCGFDICPPLKANSADKERYRRSLEEIISTYDEESLSEDGKVLEVLVRGTSAGEWRFWHELNETRDERQLGLVCLAGTVYVGQRA